MTIKPYLERTDEDTPRRMFAEWLSGRLEEQYGVEAPSIAHDVAEIMDRVKMIDWCGRKGCWGERCEPDSYVFELRTPKEKYDLG